MSIQRPFRPPLEDYDGFLAQCRSHFDHEVAAIPAELDELSDLACDPIRWSALGKPSAFARYAHTRNEGENIEEQRMRMTANMIRHEHTSYDAVRNDTYERYWTPKEFGNDLWIEVMEAICGRWPVMQAVLEHGIIIRLDWIELKRSSTREEFARMSDQWTEQQRFYAEAFRDKVAFYSEMVAPLLKVGDRVKIQQFKKIVDCTIVEKSGRNVRFSAIHPSGNPYSKWTSACYIYQRNKDLYGPIDGYADIMAY